ncbi:MAG: hypothetical protein AAF480_03930 [Actinomycetota bacterium]
MNLRWVPDRATTAVPALLLVLMLSGVVWYQYAPVLHGEEHDVTLYSNCLNSSVSAGGTSWESTDWIPESWLGVHVDGTLHVLGSRATFTARGERIDFRRNDANFSKLLCSIP